MMKSVETRSSFQIGIYIPFRGPLINKFYFSNSINLITQTKSIK